MSGQIKQSRPGKGLVKRLARFFSQKERPTVQERNEAKAAIAYYGDVLDDSGSVMCESGPIPLDQKTSQMVERYRMEARAAQELPSVTTVQTLGEESNMGVVAEQLVVSEVGSRFQVERQALPPKVGPGDSQDGINEVELPDDVVDIVKTATISPLSTASSLGMAGYVQQGSPKNEQCEQGTQKYNNFLFLDSLTSDNTLHFQQVEAPPQLKGTSQPAAAAAVTPLTKSPEYDSVQHECPQAFSPVIYEDLDNYIKPTETVEGKSDCGAATDLKGLPRNHQKRLAFSKTVEGERKEWGPEHSNGLNTSLISKPDLKSQIFGNREAGMSGDIERPSKLKAAKPVQEATVLTEIANGRRNSRPSLQQNELLGQLGLNLKKLKTATGLERAEANNAGCPDWPEAERPSLSAAADRLGGRKTTKRVHFTPEKAAPLNVAISTQAVSPPRALREDAADNGAARSRLVTRDAARQTVVWSNENRAALEEAMAYSAALPHMLPREVVRRSTASPSHNFQLADKPSEEPVQPDFSTQAAWGDQVSLQMELAGNLSNPRVGLDKAANWKLQCLRRQKMVPSSSESPPMGNANTESLEQARRAWQVDDRHPWDRASAVRAVGGNPHLEQARGNLLELARKSWQARDSQVHHTAAATPAGESGNSSGKAPEQRHSAKSSKRLDRYFSRHTARHSSTTSLIKEAVHKGPQSAHAARKQPSISSFVAGRHAMLQAHAAKGVLTSSKTGPVWSGQDWEQSTLTSFQDQATLSMPPSPSSAATSIHGHALSHITHSPSRTSGSCAEEPWAPDMEALQEVEEEGEEEGQTLADMSALSFRPSIHTAPPATLTEATLESRAVLDTVACDVDLGLSTSIWPKGHMAINRGSHTMDSGRQSSDSGHPQAVSDNMDCFEAFRHGQLRQHSHTHSWGYRFPQLVRHEA